MLSYFSVKRPYTIIVAIIIIAILGVVSFTNMTTDLLPSINLPYAVVSTSYMGASPEEVEMVVTKAIEQSMSSISNIKNVSSVSRENMSLVILEFTETTNMDSAVIEMRENLDMLKAFMPEDVGSPVILKLNPDMMPVMVLTASVKGQKINESSRFIESKIIPELESVEGIASVSASGLIDSKIHVTLSDKKIKEVNVKMQEALLKSMDLPFSGIPNIPDGMNPDTAVKTPEAQVPQVTVTKDMVTGILKGQNFSMPAGYITEQGVDYLVRTGDKIKDLDQFKKLTIMNIPVPGMQPVVLEDVAEIAIVDDSNDMYTKVNGDDAVMITIQKQTEYATSDVAKSIHAKINSIMKNNGDVRMIPLMDQGKYIGVAVNSISRNLVIGGILAILVLLIFLRDIKPTLVVGLAIPVSLVTAFVMMYFSNITLNVISMGGLALGVGMLVDNSIVVIENIYRMRAEGRNAMEAAVEGAKQVAGAITASTLTTIAVFVPILFTYGLTRQIFTDMGMTIAYSLIASLIIALTLVPMVASKIMRKDANKEHKAIESIKRGYTSALEFSLRHKWVVVLTVLVLLIASTSGALYMGTELFPESDTGQLSVTVTMPGGAVSNDTAAAADKVMDIISGIDEVETVGATMSGGMFGRGGNGIGRGSRDSVSMYVLLKESKTRTTSEVAQIIRDKTNDLGFEVKVNDSTIDMDALSGGKIAIKIKGRDLETLGSVGRDVAKIVADVKGTVEVSDGLEKTSPELRIVVDRDRSLAKGLTVAQVFMEINKLLKDEKSATTIAVGEKDFDVFVKDQNSKEVTRDGIMDLVIETPKGDKVSVRDIAKVQEGKGFSAINRYSQQRYITVTAELAEGYNIGKVNREIEHKLSEYKTPEGYSIDIGGENEMIASSFKDLFLMLILAVAFIYLIMVAQFQSLLSPFIVMFTIPLAFTGGFIALIVTGLPVSIVAFVGLIILSGIVVNNGIVFVDYVNVLRSSGMNKKDAIIKAGNDRLRPILMTALTTIFALSTTSIGAGQGAEMMQPMAITTIGGLIYATLLTLVFIPVLYDIFHKKDIIREKEV